MEEKNYLVKSENGVIAINNAVEQQLDMYEAVAAEEKEFKQKLLEALVANDVTNVKGEKYTFSQVVPKNTVIFDKDKFVLEQDEDLVASFSEIKTTETFDMDAFKEKYPEIYQEFVKTTDDIVIDEKSLAKKLPSIYAKYSTEIKTDKPTTLRISKNK